MRIIIWLVICTLVGCSQHQARTINTTVDPTFAHQALQKQFQLWKGSPYRFGGVSRRGVDCSGFVMLSFRQRFGMRLPHSTKLLSQLGEKISQSQLQSGDLVFFKTGNGWGERALHVGIYDTHQRFIHASTSRGVIRSSLYNSYWRKTYWQARRL